jgi:nitrite reductase/ring-hydroxylating ferredoxin subunit
MNYVYVGSASDVIEGEPRRVKAGRVWLALVRVGERIHAIADTCTHEEASLSEGYVGGEVIECPRHGARYNVTTGDALTLPALKPLRTYPVLVDGDDLLVGISVENRDAIGQSHP